MTSTIDIDHLKLNPTFDWYKMSIVQVYMINLN